MKALFFKTKEGQLINLSKFSQIYPLNKHQTELSTSVFDSEILDQPIEDIENFLLKVQGAL
jgi:hypothetical protein